MYQYHKYTDRWTLVDYIVIYLTKQYHGTALMNDFNSIGGYQIGLTKQYHDTALMNDFNSIGGYQIGLTCPIKKKMSRRQYPLSRHDNYHVRTDFKAQKGYTELFCFDKCILSVISQ